MAFTGSYSRQIEAHLAAAAAAAVAISHHLAEVDRFRTLLGLRPASAAAADRAEEEKAEEEESEEEEAEEEEDEFFGRGVKRRRHEVKQRSSLVTDLAARVLTALRKPHAKMGLSISTLAELCAQEVPLIQEAVDMLVHDGDAEPTDIQGDQDDETVFAV